MDFLVANIDAILKLLLLLVALGMAVFGMVIGYVGLRYFAAINGWYGGALTNEECRAAYERWSIEPHPDLGYWIVFVALMALASWFIWAFVTSPAPGI